MGRDACPRRPQRVHTNRCRTLTRALIRHVACCSTLPATATRTPPSEPPLAWGCRPCSPPPPTTTTTAESNARRISASRCQAGALGQGVDGLAAPRQIPEKPPPPLPRRDPALRLPPLPPRTAPAALFSFLEAIGRAKHLHHRRRRRRPAPAGLRARGLSSPASTSATRQSSSRRDRIDDDDDDDDGGHSDDANDASTPLPSPRKNVSPQPSLPSPVR